MHAQSAGLHAQPGAAPCAAHPCRAVLPPATHLTACCLPAGFSWEPMSHWCPHPTHTSTSQIGCRTPQATRGRYQRRHPTRRQRRLLMAQQTVQAAAHVLGQQYFFHTGCNANVNCPPLLAFLRSAVVTRQLSCRGVHQSNHVSPDQPLQPPLPAKPHAGRIIAW